MKKFLAFHCSFNIFIEKAKLFLECVNTMIPFKSNRCAWKWNTSRLHGILILFFKKNSKHLGLSLKFTLNRLGSDPMIKTWDQEIYFLCDLRFEPCGCLYDSHWRLIWSLSLGPVELVEVYASWPETNVKLKKIYSESESKEQLLCFWASIL